MVRDAHVAEGVEEVAEAAGGDDSAHCRWGCEERWAVFVVVGVAEEAVELEREEVDAEHASDVDDGAPLLADAA